MTQNSHDRENFLHKIIQGFYDLEKISIIIPTYNVARYIDRCLESVCNQTYKNIEIICIDDGSTDDTLAHIEKYTYLDNRIILIENEHIGVAAVRNKGLKIATGEYLGFVDADDYIDLKMYETLYSTMIKEEVDLTICGYERKYESFNHRKESDLFYDKKFSFPPGKSTINNETVSYFMITLWSKLYKNSIIQENNVSFANNLIFEDWVFYWEYLVNAKNLFFLEDIMYFYTQREKSIMSSIYENPSGGTADTLDYMLTAEVIYDNLLKSNHFNQYEKAFWKCYSLIYENAYYFIKEEKKEDVTKRAVSFLKNFDLSQHKNNMTETEYAFLSRLVAS